MHGSLHSDKSLEFYKSLKAPQRCLSIIENGFKIPWEYSLPEFWWKNNYSVKENFSFARNKVDEWVTQNFVKKVSNQPKHISPLSVSIRTLYTNKKKLRLCFDGGFVNSYMLDEKSKLPNLRLSESLIQRNDFAKIMDLRNCYFHVKLHSSDTKKICFALQRTEGGDDWEFYEVMILIYGLKPATLIIHLLTKPFQDYLLSKSIRSVIYIDDIRVTNQNIHSLEQDTKTIKQVYSNAGWVFAEDKESKSSQKYEYLGFIFDTRNLKYSVIEGKIVQVESLISKLSPSQAVTPKKVAQIVGKIISFEIACSSLPRLVLHSYFRWIPVVVKSRLDWNKSVSIPKAVLKGLKRSVDFVRKFSGTIRRKSYVYETLLPENKIKKEKIEIAGDGNDLYGCHYQVGEDFNYKIVRFDDIQKGELSSSFRELLVLHDCIKRNHKKYQSKDLVYYTDSRVLFFWNKNGSTIAHVAERLVDIVKWCLESDIILEVTWKSRNSKTISLADTSCKSDTDDFSLPIKVYKMLIKHFDMKIECDLFASTLLHRVNFFYSRIPTCGSSGANALKFEWDMTSYCHPPKNLIFKVFKKIETSTILDLLLIILKTAHDSDLKLFVEEDGCFKKLCSKYSKI